MIPSENEGTLKQLDLGQDFIMDVADQSQDEYFEDFVTSITKSHSSPVSIRQPMVSKRKAIVCHQYV